MYSTITTITVIRVTRITSCQMNEAQDGSPTLSSLTENVSTVKTETEMRLKHEMHHLIVGYKSFQSVSSGSAHVSTRLAIGLGTHGSILICSPKNRLRPLDTFFRNPCISAPDTETQSSVNGVAQGYIRAGKEACGIHSSPPWFSLASTQRKGEWEVGPAKATLLANCTGRKEIQTRSFLWTTTVGKGETEST